MGFWELLVTASMPPLQVLLIATVGAFLATKRCSVLTPDARKHLNKVVFYVFTPCLTFGSLARTVTLKDIISWWFMPVNIGIIFLCGSVLGWIVVKLLRPDQYLEGLVIASCSAGNLGNLMLIIVPAICGEGGSPFGERHACQQLGLSYATFSMALGAFYIWTYTYSLMQHASKAYKRLPSSNSMHLKAPNMDLEVDGTTQLLKTEVLDGANTSEISDQSSNSPRESITGEDDVPAFEKLKGTVHHVVLELTSPPTSSAIVGFFVGATPWLKSILIGERAPLRVIDHSLKLLGNGTIPSVTLILGGNLLKGMRRSRVSLSLIVAIILVRYIILPIIGIAVVTGVAKLNVLSSDPLFAYVLMTQFNLPPAMNIGTMAELFGIGQEECSVVFLWTYLAAALALTIWSTIYLRILV